MEAIADLARESLQLGYIPEILKPVWITPLWKGSDREEAKLAERLTLLYNTHYEAGTIMTLVSVQSEVKKFWRTIKENRELTYKGTAKAGGNQSGTGQSQGGHGNGRKGKDKKKKKKDKDKQNSSEVA